MNASGHEIQGSAAVVPGSATCELRVGGMDCASCAASVERALRNVPGVHDVQVDVVGGKARVRYAAAALAPGALEGAVRRVGYTVVPADASGPQPLAAGGAAAPAPPFWRRSGRLAVTIAAGIALALAFAARWAGLPEWAVLAMLGAASLAGGWYVVPRGARAALNGSLDMNFLMSIAAAGAWLIGEPEEAAATLFLFAVAELLESHSMDRARNAIRALMQLSPAEATVRRAAGDVRVPVGEVAVGETVVVRPGEKIPVDGEVTGGRSSVNQAPITGESMPVDKAAGAEVFAGTLNGHGALEIRSTRPASDTTLARIIHAVEEAQASRAPSQRFVDRFARVYTPLVVIGAVLIAILPPLAGQGDWDTWIYRALAMLVVACPCALVISTPVTIVSGLAGAAHAGVLIKGGAFLERLGATTTLAIDKTGTLTEGRPTLTDVVPLDGSDPDEVLRLAVAVERYSEHPIARAVLAEAEARALGISRAEEFHALVGLGASATVGEARVLVGNERLLDARGLRSDAVTAALAGLEARGRTAVAVIVERDGRGTVRGVLGIADRPRANARAALDAVRSAGVRHVVMLTGDNAGTARAVAGAVGVDEVHAALLPDDKVRLVRELEARGERVAFVGDGVNDAPALAAADVGIAMGAAGTDVALETADVALMADDLEKLSLAVRLSNRTMRIMKQNIVVSLVIKAVFLVLAAGGWATLWMAVAADTGGSLLVVANGLRARKALLLVLLGALAPLAGAGLAAQAPRDSLVRVDVRVVHDAAPLEAAIVRAGRAGAQTNADGAATLRLSPGPHVIVAAKLGLRPDSVVLALRPGRDTAVTIALEPSVTEVEAVIVSATRSERRVEDVPLRVEVIDEEEIAEKVAMTPGDIAMMLNETAGLRVQTTSPSLGGANVRIQGLVGRYSLLLADGLPLYGGQAGGLGLLQIPPLDLGRVEIIKGSASALYGASALGGVVNLLSRRPGEEAAHTALLNQTSRGGMDAVAFLSAPLAARWGYTLLAGAHRQARRDVDADGWTDLPGYERVVARPRFYFEDGRGRAAFVTAGFTGESRTGGTLEGRLAPDGAPFTEGLATRRGDIGALARWVVQDPERVLHGAIVTVRGSLMEQRHRHTFGSVREEDHHRTWFGEAALAVPRGRITLVGGAAIQQDRYRAADVAGFDYTFTVPAVFAQADVDPATWASISASVRADAHPEYGTAVNPRVSLLLRRPAHGQLAGWTTRLSLGAGEFAPTPFTEETEATGLTPLLPLAGLVAERATSASFDVGGPLETRLGHLELNATAFASHVRDPLQVVDAPGVTASGATRIRLVNAAGPTRTWGGELLARFVRELGDARDRVGDVDEHGAHEPPALRVTATYTHLRSTGCDPDAGPATCMRREVPLTPRHAAGVVAALEQHGHGRLGLEVYYTGRQALDDSPYRAESRPYVIVGLLGERAFETPAGTARAFLNLENLTDVRQTRWDPLLRPARGPGGRWTTDAWSDLVGFTVNGGVRFEF